MTDIAQIKAMVDYLVSPAVSALGNPFFSYQDTSCSFDSATLKLFDSNNNEIVDPVAVADVLDRAYAGLCKACQDKAVKDAINQLLMSQGLSWCLLEY